MALPAIVVGGLWVSIQAWLFTVAPALVTRVLIALGIGMFTYTGADFVVTEAETYIFSQLGSIPNKAYAIISMSGVDQGVRILFAAAGAYISIRVTMGAFSSYQARPASLRA